MDYKKGTEANKEKIVKDLRTNTNELKEVIECINLIADSLSKRKDLGSIELKNKQEYKRVLDGFNILERVYDYLNGNFKDKVYFSYILKHKKEEFKNDQNELIGSMLGNLLTVQQKKLEIDYKTILNILNILDLKVLVEIRKVCTGNEEDVFKVLLYGTLFYEPQITSFTTYNKEYFQKINKNIKGVEEAYTRFLEENFENTIVDLLNPIIKKTKIKQFSIISLDPDLQKILLNTKIFEKLAKVEE